MSDDQSLSSKKSHVTQTSSYSVDPFRDGSDTTSRGHEPEREAYQPPEVAKQEEANILRAKVLVALIILLAASGVGTATYLLVKDQEKTNFENQFAGYSSEIITVARQKADQLFSALDAFASSIGSQAAVETALRNTTWPFYVVPDWSAKAERLVELTGVSDAKVSLTSIVQADERAKFNEFAQQAIPKWYQESVEYENSEMTAIEFWENTIPFIYFYDPENNYQPTPVTRSQESRAVVHTYPIAVPAGSPFMSTLFDATTVEGVNAATKISKALRKPVIGFTLLNAGTDNETPGSSIVQPVYDTADTNAEDRKVVGGSGIQLHWLDYFKKILTDGEFGVIVVLRSACPNLCTDPQKAGGTSSSVVSYRIDGQNAKYLGDSDMHNPQYDDMEVSDIFVDLGIDESDLPE
eukprot:scaffold3828_cov90-Cylindrotheca_fusiformis.AAC.2